MKALEDLKNLIEYVEWLENKFAQARYYFGVNKPIFSTQTQYDLTIDGFLGNMSFEEQMKKDQENE